MTSTSVDFSVVIPAYNEEKRIGSTLDRIVAYFKRTQNTFELIVVDDGSGDNTTRVVTQSLAGIPYRLIENGVNRGKGYSVRQGVLAATGRTILFTDADLSTPIEELDKLTRALLETHDIAIGSRSVSDSDVRIHQNLLRESMGKIFNIIARALAFNGFQDSQCGFKAFRREAAQSIFRRQKINGFCFDAEILFLAQRMGYRIKEVGVRWENSPQSKVRIVRDSLGMLIDLLRIRLLHFGERF